MKNKTSVLDRQKMAQRETTVIKMQVSLGDINKHKDGYIVTHLITALHYTIILLSHEDLTAAHRRSCADDLCNFYLGEFHQPIKMLHTSNLRAFHFLNLVS